MPIGTLTADMWAELVRRDDPIKFPQIRLFDGPLRPKFRKVREVHSQRARKLRRRGEYVHFLRWERGHAIYGWSGPAPEVFRWRDCKHRDQPSVGAARIDYRLRYETAS